MLDIKNKNLSGLKFIDLFAGMGGFRIALESLGAECVFSSEWNSDARKMYLENFGELPVGDITKVNEKEIPDHDILCAGFPCQAFSISGKRLGFADTRGTLFFDVARIVNEKKPKAVFLENVKNLVTHDHGTTMRVIKETMENLGYSFFFAILNSADYEIPQKRERVYIVCFRNDVSPDNFGFPLPHEDFVSIEDILLRETEIAQIPKEQRLIHIPQNDSRLSFRPATRKGKGGREGSEEKSRRPIQIGTVGKGGQGERIYSTKGVGITLSAYGGGLFSKTGGYLIHGEVRKLYPREAARTLGFPDRYVLSTGKRCAVYQMLGNSVAINVLQEIGAKIGEILVNSGNTGNS